MAFMALLLSPHLDHPVDLSKTIKLILIHDVAEIEAGDYVAFQKQPLDKHALELKALKKLTKSLPKKYHT
jgi:putative hydrolases of HD superfamily